MAYISCGECRKKHIFIIISIIFYFLISQGEYHSALHYDCHDINTPQSFLMSQRNQYLINSTLILDQFLQFLLATTSVMCTDFHHHEFILMIFEKIAIYPYIFQLSPFLNIYRDLVKIIYLCPFY